jgi:hypothetical protein
MGIHHYEESASALSLAFVDRDDGCHPIGLCANPRRRRDGSIPAAAVRIVCGTPFLGLRLNQSDALYHTRGRVVAATQFFNPAAILAAVI